MQVPHFVLFFCGVLFCRRDSFITHRAFCDALAEENNKVSQGLMSNNLQNQMPELMPSMSMTTTPNSSSNVGNNELINNYDPKNPLKSLPQELVPMPFKSMNMAGGMFSSSSGSLFGGPRGISTSCSSLQLSSNSSSGFNYLQDGKNGCQMAGSAHMSATALLQKAAQMGATASNSTMNSPMMQKSFVSSNMAGPDNQLSNNSVRSQPPYSGAIQQHNNNNDNNNLYNNDQFQVAHNHDQQSSMVGINGTTGGFTNPFDANNTGSAVVNDMGMFSQMFIQGGDHQNSAAGFLKSLEQEDNASNSSSLIQARNNISATDQRNPTGPSRFGGGDMTTVDFLGIGGSRSATLHDQQQQKTLELEAMRVQQRLPIINPFQHQLSHADAGLDKHNIWDV